MEEQNKNYTEKAIQSWFRYKDSIRAKLSLEGCKEVSKPEIERCLGGCAGGSGLIRVSLWAMREGFLR